MDIVIRATVMFAVVYVLLRLMGKRELGQMTPFEVVTLVVIGDLVQQGVTHNDFSMTGAAIAIGTFAFWTLVMSMASFLSPRAKVVLEGSPSLLVRNGKILERELTRARIAKSELESEMRLAGVGKLEDVACAILEPNGKISFIEEQRQERSEQKDDSTPG